MTIIIQYDDHHFMCGSHCSWMATPLNGATEVTAPGSVYRHVLSPPIETNACAALWRAGSRLLFSSEVDAVPRHYAEIILEPGQDEAGGSDLDLVLVLAIGLAL